MYNQHMLECHDLALKATIRTLPNRQELITNFLIAAFEAQRQAAYSADEVAMIKRKKAITPAMIADIESLLKNSEGQGIIKNRSYKLKIVSYFTPVN